MSKQGSNNFNTNLAAKDKRKFGDTDRPKSRMKIIKLKDENGDQIMILQIGSTRLFVPKLKDEF